MSDDLDDLVAAHKSSVAPAGDDMDALVAEHKATAKPAPATGLAHELSTMLFPEPGAAPSKGTPYAEAALNGLTLGHAGQAAGWLQDKVNSIPLLKSGSLPQTGDDVRREFAQATADHPLADIAGAFLMPVPGVGKLKSLKGAAGVASRLLANGGIGAGLGAATESNAPVLKRAAIGFGAGVLGGGVGEALGAIGRHSASKVAGIDEAVARKAAEQEAAVTASARSQAGRDAQDTYKQLEHLRELNGKGLLSAEGQQMAAQLESELAQKAAEKFPQSVARKEASAQAYAEAMASESQRAQQAAEQKLSGGEFKQQVGARLLRYGLPAALGAVGTTLAGHGPAEGALFGGALGHTFRPMMHSLKRLASQPVVQRPVFNALSRLSPAATEGTLPALVERLEPSVPMSPAYAEEDDDITRALAQATALRRKDKP
jgi:hypothetical protein